MPTEKTASRSLSLNAISIYIDFRSAFFSIRIRCTLLLHIESRIWLSVRCSLAFIIHNPPLTAVKKKRREKTGKFKNSFFVVFFCWIKLVHFKITFHEQPSTNDSDLVTDVPINFVMWLPFASKSIHVRDRSRVNFCLCVLFGEYARKQLTGGHQKPQK